MAILRTECAVEYTTPAGTTRILPINCANSNADRWPWEYLAITTLDTQTPTRSPQTTSEFRRSPAAALVKGQSIAGQVVVRLAFAYVATSPIYAFMGGYLKMDAGGSAADWRPNYNIDAGLYRPNGDKVKSLMLEPNKTQHFTTVTLPATDCPLVVFALASVQPFNGPLSELPVCEGTISASLQGFMQ